MKKYKSLFKSLPKYVDYLQSRGNYILLRENAINVLGISAFIFNTAVFRLAQKNRIISVRQGFYIIVPLEYRNAGSIPASWFVDSLMRFHKQPYYVGLLSAAALHGAAHQQPQEFQVITNKTLRPIIVGRTQIRFFLKRDIDPLFISKVKTATGYMCVSTPEVTALDLLRYVGSAGQINNAATVIMELAEKIDDKKLSIAASKFELPIVQRLGYLLDTFTDVSITKSLYKWLARQNTVFTSLVPGKKNNSVEKNQKWKVLVNKVLVNDEIGVD